MKREHTLLPIAAAIAFTFMGCSKQESTPPSVAKDAEKAAAPVADTLKQTTESVKSAAETAAADVTKQAQEVAGTATAKAQEWIDKAKNFVAEKKFSDAASALQQLTGLKLTEEQQKLVSSLKEQIQKALATTATNEAATAVGNLLKK